MLKFFRRLRQKLIEEGNLKKYLIYAIGEIFLVVIGILIALQINNINENKKTYEKQRNYLKLIKEEMTNNLRSLQQLEEKLLIMIEGQKEFIGLIDQPSEEVSEVVLAQTWSKVFSKSVNYPNEHGALTEVISTGGLKDIVNDEIRNILASWEGRLQRVKDQEKDVNGYLQKGNDFMEKNGHFRAIFDNTGGVNWLQVKRSPDLKSNKILLDSPEFENILTYLLATGQNLSGNMYPSLEQDIIKLIEMIDEELYKGNKEEFNSLNEDGVVMTKGYFRKGFHYSSKNSEGQGNWASQIAEIFCMDYPGSREWGVALINVNEANTSTQTNRDFSRYQQLVLEMESDQEEAQVAVSLKDINDSQEGKEEKKLVQLTKEWKTYTFDLRNDFPNLDLKNISTVVAFSFGKEAQNVCVKKIYFQ